MNRKHSNSYGFTLIEILVALTLLTISISVAFGVNSSIGKNLVLLDTNNHSMFVANQLFSEYRALQKWPSTGKHTLEYSAFNKLWQLELTIEETGTPSLMRATLTNSAHPHTPALIQTLFLSQSSHKKENTLTGRE